MKQILKYIGASLCFVIAIPSLIIVVASLDLLSDDSSTIILTIFFLSLCILSFWRGVKICKDIKAERWAEEQMLKKDSAMRPHAGARYSDPAAGTQESSVYSASSARSLKHFLCPADVDKAAQTDPYSPAFKMPYSKRKRTEIANKLEVSVRANKLCAESADTIHGYLLFYDAAIKDYRALEKFQWVINNPRDISTERRNFEHGIQRQIHSILERGSQQIIKQYNGIYKYDREYINRKIQEFWDDVDSTRDRLSAENWDYAHALFLYLCNECKAHALLDAENSADSSLPLEDGGLAKVDTMDGHTFEHWCADLLRKCGYSNVEVTPGSNDQGVDVLAQKGGVKYAIQCKCYSSDLGNTPVQEVNTGKVVYHCQIGVVMTNRHFTKGAIDAAEATGTLLWDRDKLVEMMNSVK